MKSKFNAFPDRKFFFRKRLYKVQLVMGHATVQRQFFILIAIPSVRDLDKIKPRIKNCGSFTLHRIRVRD